MKKYKKMKNITKIKITRKMNLIQLPNEILEIIFWKILDKDNQEDLSFLMRKHEQRVFLLTQYMKICKKFQDII